MLLIYSAETSTRLQYICKFIFEKTLKISYNLTGHADSFSSHDGDKINYSDTSFDDSYQIKPHGLLFETGITQQVVECYGEENNKIFFPSEGADHSFDIFSAAFYLITRYEEYLPHTEDMYGRYAHENAVAYKEGFLKLPLVNIWLKDFKEKLIQRFPRLEFQPKVFRFIPTYDIDMAWSYKSKGFFRNAAGFIKKPSVGRLSTLFGRNKDPFDCYHFLNEIHNNYKLDPLYFFLVAKQNGVYDKNILSDNKYMQELIKKHADKYKIGLHPSWKSNDDFQILNEEKTALELISEKEINSSRQHYIKFTLPHTYRQLIKAGITEDYSMGYGSINGFRASVASSFSWYDLPEEKITSLRIHPFCFMDANCFYEEKLSVEDSYKELMHYYLSCKKINGTLITVFHNNFLGTDKKFSGWKELYSHFISQLPQ